jgi:hypothetical protein
MTSHRDGDQAAAAPETLVHKEKPPPPRSLGFAMAPSPAAAEGRLGRVGRGEVDGTLRCGATEAHGSNFKVGLSAVLGETCRAGCRRSIAIYLASSDLLVLTNIRFPFCVHILFGLYMLETIYVSILLFDF